MNKMIDKHLIYVICLLLIVSDKMAYEPVVAALVAVTAMELATYFTKVKAWFLVVAVYCVGCLFFSWLLFFLPAMLYEFAEREKWWGYGVLVVFFLLLTEIALPWQIGLWWVAVALSALLAVRMRELAREHRALIALRDESVEEQQTMKKRNRELLEKQDYEIHVATLSERNRIAREIHDNVGHMLSRCILQMGALMAVHKKEEALYEQLSSVNASLNEAMNNIRESVHDLHDESVDLKQAILEATSDMKKKYTFVLEYDMSNQVPRNVKYCMIAIVKEGMANIVKHSDATRVTVMLREHPGFYQLAIEDNGTKLQKNLNPGIGLNNMRERVEALDGTINLSAENGFRILVSLRKDLTAGKGGKQ